VFARIKEWQYAVVPANQVITPNKALGLSTFLGVDGHAATAEIRPTPSYNIRRHLYDIAYGLVTTDAYLRRYPKWKDVRMVALPYVGQEALGGHIHATLFVMDPTMWKLQLTNRVYLRDFDIYNPQAPTTPANQSITNMCVKHLEDINAERTVTPDLFGRVLNYLLAPFERWIQPWHSRIRRNHNYGTETGGDLIRYSYLPRPERMPKFNDWAYLHFEYRLPSTWLANPWLAYAYLGLAKFSLLNWDTIVPLIRGRDTSTDVRAASSEPDNGRFWQIFIDRWREIRGKRMLESADLHELDTVFDFLRDSREQIFAPYAGIQIDAWRKLLE
jgi:hypothetical protein